MYISGLNRSPLNPFSPHIHSILRLFVCVCVCALCVCQASSTHLLIRNLGLPSVGFFAEVVIFGGLHNGRILVLTVNITV